jgi:hypothetical protein
VLLPEEVAVARFGGDEWSMETNLDDEAREAAQEAADTRAEQMSAALAEQPPPPAPVGPAEPTVENGPAEPEDSNMLSSAEADGAPPSMDAA